MSEKDDDDDDDEKLYFVSELWKRSDILRRWNVRYFELDNDGILRFYQEKRSRRLRGVFVLNLKGNEVRRTDTSDPRVITFVGIGQKWHEHAIAPRKIVAATKSVLILRAVNLSTASKWIVALNRFIHSENIHKQEYTTDEMILAKRIYDFPNLVNDDGTFAACDAIAFLMIIIKVPSLGIALSVMNSMVSKSLIESVDKRHHKDSAGFRNEFVMYKFLIEMKKQTSKTLKKPRATSKDFFSTNTLAQNMAQVQIAAALAASDSRTSDMPSKIEDEYDEDEEEEDEEEEQELKLNTMKRIDSSDDNEGITRAQRESIDRLLLHTSSTPPPSSKYSTLSFNPFRSRDVSKILRRKLKQYISDLQKLQKSIMNAYNASCQSSVALQKKWKDQQSKLRKWAREEYIPIFKSRAELRMEKCRIETETIQISMKVLCERVEMASNLTSTLEQLNITERSVFAKQIDESFFVIPENLVREAQLVTREDLQNIRDTLEKLEIEMKRDVGDKLSIMSDERRTKTVRDAVKNQMRVIRSGRYIVSKSARISFRSAVADERTDLGRLLKRYRGKVNEVCTSKLPPPTIIKTFATYFSDKVADELNLKDLVGNMNDEIQSNGGERKEETARCLDILTEDLIMGTLEVTDLCNQYFKEELRRCDKHWQDQQSWLRKIGARELSVPCEFLPPSKEENTEYMNKSRNRMNEWANETASGLNPTLMRMKLLRAIRTIHEESSLVSFSNTGKKHKLTGETLVPILVYVLIHATDCHHLHRSIFLMQQVALQEWNSSSEVAYYLTALTAALAFICHLKREGNNDSTKEEAYVVGENPNESDFQKIFSGSSQRDKEECLREMQDFIASQEAVEDLLESFGFS